LGLLVLSVALAVLGAAVGSTGLASMASAWGDTISAQIVWDIRLPRSLGAWAAGALLGLGGAIAQGLFRNPLADPYLLGSASGASLGVATAMALFGVTPMASAWAGRLGLTSAAFVGAVGAVVLTLLLARGVQHTIRLLLAGVVVGVVLGAVGSLVLLLSPQTLLAMQTFMLGSTSFVGWGACVLMVVVWLLCTALAWWMAPVLDGLALGEFTARSLGLPLERTRALLVVVLGLATATAVAQTGLIAFVGLAAPHVVRALVRCSQGTLLLLSSAMGGVLLMAADLLARGLVSPLELPVGLLTAVLGGGYLLWLMRRGSPTRFGGAP
jgi:iron complex transport system permease protein